MLLRKKYKIGKVLDKLCNDDMFTSRFEVYVSFPMFYAEVAQELAVKLNMCKIGSHNVAAWISYEGKKTPAQQVNDTSNPATIGYIGLINREHWRLISRTTLTMQSARETCTKRGMP